MGCYATYKISIGIYLDDCIKNNDILRKFNTLRKGPWRYYAFGYFSL